MSARELPRYIKIENVSIGDTVRVCEVYGDLTVERVGTVAARHYEGTDRVLTTESGAVLCRWNVSLKPRRVTLLARAEVPQQILSGFDKLLEGRV